MVSSKIHAAAESSRNAALMASFFGSHHFAKANEINDKQDKVLANCTPSPEFLALEKTCMELQKQLAQKDERQSALEEQLSKKDQMIEKLMYAVLERV